jgi:hypothetical protein
VFLKHCGILTPHFSEQNLCEVDKSVIQDLLEKPFSRTTFWKKLKIIKDERPSSPLSSLKNVHTDKKDTLGMFRFCNMIFTHS